MLNQCNINKIRQWFLKESERLMQKCKWSLKQCGKHPQMKADSVHFILIMIMSFHIKDYMSMQPKHEKTLLLSKLNSNLTHVTSVYNIILCWNVDDTDAKPIHTRIPASYMHICYFSVFCEWCKMRMRSLASADGPHVLPVAVRADVPLILRQFETGS